MQNWTRSLRSSEETQASCKLPGIFVCTSWSQHLRKEVLQRKIYVGMVCVSIYFIYGRTGEQMAKYSVDDDSHLRMPSVGENT